MFITLTAKQRDQQNQEIIRKNREHDERKRAEQTPARRAEKGLNGSRRLLKRIARECEAETVKQANKLVEAIEKNHRIFLDCEAELAKPSTRQLDVARSMATQELRKKLPACFPSEAEAAAFAQKLVFEEAAAADLATTEKRARLAKKRTTALTAILNDCDEIGRLAGLQGDIRKEVFAMGELD